MLTQMQCKILQNDGDVGLKSRMLPDAFPNMIEIIFEMSNYTFLIQPNTLVQKWKAIQCPEATARICQGSNSKTLKRNLMENKKNNNSKLRCSLKIFTLGIKHFKSLQIKGVKMARHF